MAQAAIRWRIFCGHACHVLRGFERPTVLPGVVCVMARGPPGADTLRYRSRFLRHLRRPSAADARRRPKVCQFCKDKTDYIDYKDVAVLRKYMSDRGKIRARRVTGACPKHQRELATAIKNAREMALLPYISQRG